MSRLFVSCAYLGLLFIGRLYGQETISSSVRKSTAANVETEIASLLEKSKAEIDFCKINRGRGFEEIDVSKMGSMEGYGMCETCVKAITDGLIASKYEWYGDLSKAADYYYKDYLVEIGQRHWNDKRSWGSPGDSTPFPIFMYVLKRNQDYKRMLKVYPEYFDYCFFADTNRYKGTREEKIKILKKQTQYDSELKSAYDDFMKDWTEVKKLAKTIKPIPLDPAVQNHEWFYSAKQEEVLKALEYYYTNKVGFMLEKALKHKASVIAATAKEYIDKLNLEKPVAEDSALPDKEKPKNLSNE